MAISARSTISFNKENWQMVKDEKNKSRLVNEAIRYFYDAKEFLKEKEEDFILSELVHYDSVGESYSYEDTFGKKLIKKREGKVS